MSMVAASPRTASFPASAPASTDRRDFAAIAEMVYGESANVLPQGKAMLVYSRIAPLVRKSGKTTFADYVALIRNDPGERKQAVEALTTNHTFFYREAHHFEHFAETVRPQLITRLQAGEKVRLWSAGCSSGEETWSLVLTLLGEDLREGKQPGEARLRVLASDLSAMFCKRRRQGTYAEADVKDVPKALCDNWLTSSEGKVSVGAKARSIVRFRELNLLGDWPMKQKFDAIFCRNVMIYFDQPTNERLLARFAAQLKPGGYLYIGHSERVSGPAAGLLDAVGPTIYERKRT
jgi:chemotaxis protein methyltransferase CheR